MSTVAPVQTPNTHTPPEVSDKPLSNEEKTQFISYAMSSFSLTEEQASTLADGLPPTAARTYMDLASGKTSITREQAQEMWGLTDQEAETLFGDKKQIGMFDNPFGDLFLQFLMLSYSLGLDIKKMMSSVSHMRFDEAIGAAKDRKEGALNEFICSMVAAGVTLGFGMASMYRIKVTSADKMTQHNQMLQWFSPVTAQLLGAPITAIGGFTKSTEDYEASVKDANSQLYDTVFQQLMNTWQGSTDASRTYTSGL